MVVVDGSATVVLADGSTWTFKGSHWVSGPDFAFHRFPMVSSQWSPRVHAPKPFHYKLPTLTVLEIETDAVRMIRFFYPTGE